MITTKSLFLAFLVCSFLVCEGYQSYQSLFGRGKFRKSFVVKSENEGGGGKSKRQDTCIVILSGVVGADSREFYLRDNHYRQIFPVGITSYFDPIFDSEKENSHQNTVWIPSEAFDDLAKDNIDLFQKGRVIHAVGTLLINNWIDKATGEERKQFRFRATKILKPEEFETLKKILSSEISQHPKEKGISRNREEEEKADNPLVSPSFSQPFQKYSTPKVSAVDSFIKQEITKPSSMSSNSVQNRQKPSQSKQISDENSLPPTIRRTKAAALNPQKGGKLPPSSPKPTEVTHRAIEQPYEEMEMISFGNYPNKVSESMNTLSSSQPKLQDLMMSSRRPNPNPQPMRVSTDSSDSWDVLERQLHM